MEIPRKMLPHIPGKTNFNLYVKKMGFIYKALHHGLGSGKKRKRVFLGDENPVFV
ncbi:hypothetical protein HYV84_04940 [Candidatus Woesearchaeota archaeon]|nr:hypothetical protein [Candidatus Woesearchaeota archaeon]